MDNRSYAQHMEKHPTNQQHEKANAEHLQGDSDVNRLPGREIQPVFLPTPSRIKRLYWLAGTVLLLVVLLRPSWIPRLRYGKCRTHGDSRLLRFSATHKEWVPSTAIDYLLSMRNAVDDEGSWAGVMPTGIDVVRLRGDGNGVLEGVSDDAVRALAGREGYRVGYLDATDSSGGDATLLWPHTGEEVVGLPYDAVDPGAHQEYKDLVKMVSVDELKYIVGNLSTSFKTRYYRGLHARAPAEWIQSYLEPLPNSTVTLFENSFNQPNVITRLAPPNSDLSSPTILLGGHLDSTSPIPLMLAPGADDDASGTAVVMHVISILAKSGWAHSKSKYPIEAHAYGGEEGGLLGAVALSKSYHQAGREIRGVLNVEMVGWQPESGNNTTSTITVLSDPNASMSAYMKEVVETYIPTADVRGAFCGYGCSDHYAWSGLGYPVVCIASYGPSDRNLNPNYHSTRDRMESLDFERMADFARAAIAWVVQVSG